MAVLVNTPSQVIAVQHAMTDGEPYVGLKRILGKVLASYFQSIRDARPLNDFQEYWKADEDMKEAVILAANARFDKNEKIGIKATKIHYRIEKYNTDFLSRNGLKFNFTTAEFLKQTYEVVKGKVDSPTNCPALEEFYRNNGVEPPKEDWLKKQEENILNPLEEAVKKICDFWGTKISPEEKAAKEKTGCGNTRCVTKKECRKLLADFDYTEVLGKTKTPSKAAFFHICLLCCINEKELEACASILGRCMIGENIHMGVLRELVVKEALRSFFDMVCAEKPGMETGMPANWKQMKWNEWLKKAGCAYGADVIGLDVIDDFWISLARAMRAWDVKLEEVNAISREKDGGSRNDHLCDTYFNKRSNARQTAYVQLQAEGQKAAGARPTETDKLQAADDSLCSLRQRRKNDVQR